MELIPEIWSPEEGRWTALKNSWKNGENKWRLFFIFIGSIPIWAFGERRYYDSVHKYGSETFYAPHNLVREGFHYLGGITLGLCAVFNLALLWLTVIAVFIGATLNEVFSDIPESGLRAKNFFDVFFWTLGALTVVWIQRFL
jgi:hypothetical protein